MSQNREVVGPNDSQSIIKYIGNNTIKFAQKHYILSALWLFGLILFQFANGLTIPEEKLEAFQQKLQKIDFEELSSAHTKVALSEERYQNSRGFFFRCDDTCISNYQLLTEAKEDLKSIEKEISSIKSDANAIIGIFSEHGVQETKDIFWKALSSGKNFAKRQSLWDIVFLSTSSSNDSIVGVLIQWLFSVMINFTVGLFSGVAIFCFKLYSLITSFQADFFTAVIYFSLAFISAVSFVSLYLLGIYGAAVGSIYVITKQVGSIGNRIEQENKSSLHLQDVEHIHKD